MIGRALVLLSIAASLCAANPGAPKTILDQGADHWAFKPIQKVGPSVLSRPLAVSRIDDLVAARLKKEGLSFSKEASRAILIRRLYFDLIGFPPDPQEVREFIADRDPEAYEKLVDRLLASPHFGERWARH